MKPIGSVLLVGVALTVAFPARAQMGIPRGQTPVISVLTPTGNMAKLATTGVGAALQTSFMRDDADWGTRVSIGIERFNGKKPVTSIQYLSTGFDVVHRSGRIYQFGGFAFAQGRTNYDTSAATSPRRSTFGFDLGVSAGLGIQFGSPGAQVRTFLEAGYVNVFRDGGNDTWVPVRFGIKF